MAAVLAAVNETTRKRRKRRSLGFLGDGASVMGEVMGASEALAVIGCINISKNKNRME